MLIRPDGFVAWAGTPEQPDHDGLKNALGHWFGVNLTTTETFVSSMVDTP
ncbi:MULTISPECIES: aromatic-ring hydroxylase C-terminal domain-containing protein [Mycobacteroides]